MEKELINQEEAVDPTILDLLLGKNVVAVNKQLPTAQYEVPRLSAAAGKPVVFTLRALPYGRVQEAPDRRVRHPDPAGRLCGAGSEGPCPAGEVQGCDAGGDHQGPAASR